MRVNKPCFLVFDGEGFRLKVPLCTTELRDESDMLSMTAYSVPDTPGQIDYSPLGTGYRAGPSTTSHN